MEMKVTMNYWKQQQHGHKLYYIQPLDINENYEPEPFTVVYNIIGLIMATLLLVYMSGNLYRKKLLFTLRSHRLPEIQQIIRFYQWKGKQTNENKQTDQLRIAIWNSTRLVRREYEIQILQRKGNKLHINRRKQTYIKRKMYMAKINTEASSENKIKQRNSRQIKLIDWRVLKVICVMVESSFYYFLFCTIVLC